MMAGRLRERLQVMEMSVEQTGFSSGRPSYTPRPGFIRAELRRQTGRSRAEGGEVFAAYSAEFNVREEHDLKEGDRLLHLRKGGLLYKIENILLNPERRMKTLQCSKVNR